jgi:hypothetical protein
MPLANENIIAYAKLGMEIRKLEPDEELEGGDILHARGRPVYITSGEGKRGLKANEPSIQIQYDEIYRIRPIGSASVELMEALEWAWKNLVQVSENMAELQEYRAKAEQLLGVSLKRGEYDDEPDTANPDDE